MVQGTMTADLDIPRIQDTSLEGDLEGSSHQYGCCDVCTDGRVLSSRLDILTRKTTQRKARRVRRAVSPSLEGKLMAIRQQVLEEHPWLVSTSYVQSLPSRNYAVKLNLLLTKKRQHIYPHAITPGEHSWCTLHLYYVYTNSQLRYCWLWKHSCHGWKHEKSERHVCYAKDVEFEQDPLKLDVLLLQPSKVAIVLPMKTRHVTCYFLRNLMKTLELLLDQH